VLAIGNDAQFARFVAIAGHPELATDPRFARNKDRVLNRDSLIPILEALTRQRDVQDWLADLDASGIPAGPINDLAQTFASPQVAAREMKISLPHPVAASGQVALIGNPVKFSATPVTYQGAPPVLGQHTAEVLSFRLGLPADALERLAAAGVIGGDRV
jgi:crotonobetainyl-CoA:carnitine CoA-transferase CaiB-like acyl-CoA transferase